ncbi:MAG: hypothetical protein ABJO67_21410 [Pseudoruegeria sp.]
MLDQLPRIISDAIAQQNILLEAPIDLSEGPNSPLYGVDSQIDSLTLVSILVDVEATVLSELSLTVHLADTSDLKEDEKPFATYGSLCAYTRTRCAAASRLVSV